jgi:glyoxylase-like metal-dependent hydrolase (beta-lactamase superfamily II)
MNSSPKRLGVNVFTAPGKAVAGERPRPFGEPLGWDPITSTLIYGEYDAVLVDTLATVAEAEALADWVALHHRNLTTIYVTHGHFDHFFGLSVLLDRFPGARAIATPKSVELMHEQVQTATFDHFLRRWWPGQLPALPVMAEPYPDNTFTLESNELRIIEQGRTDTVHTTSLHVPSIDLVVGGDVLYNQCHMYVGTPHREPAQLDRGAGPAGGAAPKNRCRRTQETGCARFAVGDTGQQALPRRLRPTTEEHHNRRRTVQRDDQALPRLGIQPIMVDVWFPSFPEPTED